MKPRLTDSQITNEDKITAELVTLLLPEQLYCQFCGYSHVCDSYWIHFVIGATHPSRFWRSRTPPFALLGDKLHKILKKTQSCALSEGLSIQRERVGNDELSPVFSPLKEDLRIGAVFSVNPGAEAQAQQSLSAPSLHMSCSHCKKSLLKGQTAFQRKGSPALFCSTACLTTSLPAIKGGTKVCHNCQK